MANIISSVGNFLNAANSKADRLTSIAKGALCIPSMIAGLPDFGRSLIGNIKITDAVIGNLKKDIISDLIIGSIGGVVDKITGSINSLIGSVAGLISSLGGVYEQGKDFYEDTKTRVKDIKNFSESKENCNFAAATLLNCITSQALSNFAAKDAVKVSKKLRSISSFTNELSDKIASPTGAINNTINKAAYEVSRAERVMSKSNIF